MNYRVLLYSIGLAVITLGCSGSEESQETTENVQTANATATIVIDGMMCQENCANSVQSSLSSIKGVDNCTVDFESKTATVVFNNGLVTEDKLKSAVTGLNDGQYSISSFTVKVEQTSAFKDVSNAAGSDNLNADGSQIEMPNFLDLFKGIL